MYTLWTLGGLDIKTLTKFHVDAARRPSIDSSLDPGHRARRPAFWKLRLAHEATCHSNSYKTQVSALHKALKNALLCIRHVICDFVGGSRVDPGATSNASYLGPQLKQSSLRIEESCQSWLVCTNAQVPRDP